MIVVPTSTGFVVGAMASLIETGDTLQAWAERHVRQDHDLRWILGNFVEANQANSNGHIFPLADLVDAQRTIAGKPLTMLHRTHYIVGAYAGAQLVTPEGVEITADNMTAAEATDVNPVVEALAGMWHNRFPEEFFNIQRAHKDGSLFFSMEAVPESVSCPTCEVSADFAGIESPSYCDHMQGATGPKILHKPHFAGGAIIIPPVQPGWKRADVTAISKLMSEHAEQADVVHAQIEAEAPHLGASEWELLMGEVLSMAARSDAATMPTVISQGNGNVNTTTMDSVTWNARGFTPMERKDAADKGKAMPSGGFPIMNVADLRNAIKAIGRAKDPAAAKAHIKKMAKKLGREDLIPPGW